MIGAIAGDIIGSVYEHHPIKTKDFPLFLPACEFTDDTVLTIAVATAILTGQPYGEIIGIYGRKYPHRGYGGNFREWLRATNPRPYNSWGNGSAMRVSPIGWAFDNAQDVLKEAKASSEITHDHPEGVKGAQATALAVFLARTGSSKDEIRQSIAAQFGYNLARSLDSIRPGYSFDVSCQGTVPEAIIAFLESTSFEDAIRNAVSLGGDADTLACISGGIAEAHYGGVPGNILKHVDHILPAQLRDDVRAFSSRYKLPGAPGSPPEKPLCAGKTAPCPSSPLRLLLLLFQELLHRGYGRLRLISYIKEGLGALRVGFYIRGDGPGQWLSEPFPASFFQTSFSSFSSESWPTFFTDYYQKGLSIPDLLVEFDARFSEHLAHARSGNYDAYLKWFDGMVEASSPDGFYNIEEHTILFPDGRNIPYMAPPRDTPLVG